MNDIFTWNEINYVEELSNKLDTLENKDDIDQLVSDLIYKVSDIMMDYNRYKINSMSDQDFREIYNNTLIGFPYNEAHLYIFCSWHNIDLFKEKVGAYFNVKNILIWEKNNTGMGDLEGDYAPKYEMILFCSNGSKKLNGGRDANILKAKRTGNKNHPTEKPVNLISYLIEKSSNENDIVLDTFAGSFSTAQACKQKKRNFICFEIEEEYCRTAKNLLNGVSVSLF
jgi:DNA modification methylase